MWNPALRSGELEAVFRERGFGVIDGALEDSEAESIREEIAASEHAFRLVVRTGVHPQRLAFDKPPSGVKREVLEAQLAVARQAGLLTSLHELWEPPEGDPASAITRLFAHLRSAQTFAWIAAVTSVAVDACQVRAVTRFRQGHYVDPHSDRLVKFGKRRRIAFVLFFSQGDSGNLVLLRGDGEREASIEPRFNRLALLDVDRIHQHCVPKVVAAGEPRLAIPGFFCS